MEAVAIPHITYPESDGQPMAENTRQFRWIVFIKKNLDLLLQHDPNVFVAGDLLWYPVEGRPDIRRAPDAMVVFGRPKGDRGSYKQWEEDGIAPQVVFEILSPGNTFIEYDKKRRFYGTYGVEEYYVYHPDDGMFQVWERKGHNLAFVEDVEGWVSPRLGIRFERDNNLELHIYRPDGSKFEEFEDVAAERDRLRQEQNQMRQRQEQLEAKLRELGIDPANV
ncbi:MAG: Uma2 family endonuclease [Chloroflexaceae bacterium]|nr:Uma2 family endonuclease [Chloroflexaceae bacterium]